MKNHITHYDDCGCKSERIEKENQRLRTALEKILKHNEIVAGNAVHYSMNYRLAKEALAPRG